MSTIDKNSGCIVGSPPSISTSLIPISEIIEMNLSKSSIDIHVSDVIPLLKQKPQERLQSKVG
jgi:hypothetical protein